jgi:hypothetical protein
MRFLDLNATHGIPPIGPAFVAAVAYTSAVESGTGAGEFQRSARGTREFLGDGLGSRSRACKFL